MNKIALITGSTGTIGTAIGKRLLKDKISPIGLGLGESKNQWPEIEYDLLNLKNIDQTFSQICAAHGTPDILINNAGIYHGKKWEQITADDFDKTLDLNLKTPFWLSRIFAQRLIKENKSGVIVNIASTAGQIGGGNIPYAASKAGLIAMTKSLAKALAAHNIRVTAVAPGPIEGKICDSIPRDIQKQYIDSIALKRFGTPEEVANAVAFLASDQASYITGTVLDVNGGL